MGVGHVIILLQDSGIMPTNEVTWPGPGNDLAAPPPSADEAQRTVLVGRRVDPGGSRKVLVTQGG